MTNKEKINKMSCKEFADKFMIRGQNCVACAYWNKEHNACHSEEFYSGVDACKSGFIKWLSQEVELTSDEMFEELGYEKDFGGGTCAYIKKFREDEKIYFRGNAYYNKRIIINDSLEYWCNIAINEAEDKAIHKKIEELLTTK